MGDSFGGLDFQLAWTLGLTLVAVAGLGIVSWRERSLRRVRRSESRRRD